MARRSSQVGSFFIVWAGAPKRVSTHFLIALGVMAGTLRGDDKQGIFFPERRGAVIAAARPIVAATFTGTVQN